MTERPVECTQCKKPAKVIYKEIVGNAITCTEVCADCPILEQKLHGTAPKEKTAGIPEAETGLCCGHCRTTLDAVKMGNPVGCSECYNVFAEPLITELMEENRLPSSLKKNLSNRKNQSLHVGKAPGKEVQPLPSSSKLTALNEALNEALKKENYEEAAALRDQIKALTEKKPNDRKK